MWSTGGATATFNRALVIYQRKSSGVLYNYCDYCFTSIGHVSIRLRCLLQHNRSTSPGSAPRPPPSWTHPKNRPESILIGCQLSSGSTTTSLWMVALMLTTTAQKAVNVCRTVRFDYREKVKHLESWCINMKKNQRSPGHPSTCKEQQWK